MDHVAAPDPEWSSDDPNPGTSRAPYRIYNIGNNSPVQLNHFIATIENALGRKAMRNLLPLQPGDVPKTYADVDALTAAVGFKPSTSIEDGLGRFVAWYREYYGV
jgi:UDP-glucuronate 4-epimerase